VSSGKGAQLQAQGMWSAGGADDKERFLADLRALRDTAALEFDELAARAHYPSSVLKEAEHGPSLPTLPILAAYVRACDGDVPEWEERWRRLGVESRADPGLPVRPAGASPAAVAGARAGVSVAPPDTYDPERIRAALRGSHGRSDAGARGTVSRAAARRVEPDTGGPAIAEPRVPESPAAWSTGTSWEETTRWGADAQPGPGWDAAAQPGTGTSWDGAAQPGAGTSWDGAAQLGAGTSWDGAAQLGAGTSWDGAAQLGAGTSWDGFQRDAGPHWDGAATDGSGGSANGNHPVTTADDGSAETAVMPVADTARADALRRDPFSADWLEDTELASHPDPESDPESRSPEQAEAQASSAAPDNWFTPRETADPEPTWSPAAAEASAAAADTWFTRRERAEGGGSASPQPTEVQRPGPSAAQEHAIPQASWPAAAEAPASDAAAAGRMMPVRAQAAAAAPSRTIAGPAVPPGPVVPQGRSRSDRLYPVRLLVVIVVAALLGSILVLLLR
jgi:hypothetical protein